MDDLTTPVFDGRITAGRKGVAYDISSLMPAAADVAAALADESLQAFARLDAAEVSA